MKIFLSNLNRLGALAFGLFYRKENFRKIQQEYRKKTEYRE